MPRFKHPDTGNIVERSEEFAVQVLRPQGIYIELPEEVEAPVKVVAPEAPKPVAKKKSKKLS